MILHPTTTGGDPHERDHMLIDSQKSNECVSKFQETIHYVLVQPISVPRFCPTVCKLGGAVPLAPGHMRITNKCTCSISLFRLWGLISAHHYAHVLNVRVQFTYASWEPRLSLTVVWTWGQRAAAASQLLGAASFPNC